MRKARGFHIWGMHWTRYFALREMLFGLCICSMGSAAVFPQESGAGSGAGPEQETRKQVSQTAANKGSRPSPDVATDNLDRVAATAEQILDFLKRDAGLMVVFKRVLAQDAGNAGQLLDETDLTDAAVIERLNDDLRARVLATRLLQRYGYLLPKLNPDSDLAAEHNLVLQDRAYAIAHAMERNAEPHTLPPATQTAGCDPEISSDCDFPAQGTRRTSSPIEVEEQPNRPAEQPNPYEGYPTAPSRTDTPQAPRELRADLSASDTGEPLLTSLQQGSLDTSGNSANLRARGGSREGEGATSSTAVEFAPSMSSALSQPENISVRRTSSNSAGRRVSNSAASEFAAAALEPVRMVHRPNPYADAPSLYDLYVQAAAPAQHAERFGLDVFRHDRANTGALPMDLPVGPEYVVGPGDGLSIDLWGGVSQRLFRTVDREGRLQLPEAGPLLVSGKSLGEVQESVQRVLRTQFRDVSADVSLLRLRSVRVYVVGEVASPGAYDVSSLSTPLNALFSAGGVTPRGSLRSIEHYRGKTLLEEVDAYDLLLHGVRGDLKRLENGDSLRIPPLGPSITVEGMVRRPAVYELHGEKNLGEVLDLAGGILPAAALRHIEVQRMEAHEKRTMLSLDVGENSDKDSLRIAFEKFQIQDGDEIHIFPIAPYNGGSVYLEGHVLRPGQYSFHDGMKLTDLVSSYKELLPEPAERYAEIIRIAQPDNRPVVQSFNLAAALEHPENSPKLEPLDTVRIFGRYELEAAPEIAVIGEVRAAGRYRASGQEHLRDAIYQAGGLTPDSWLESAQLFRALPDGTTKVFSISLRAALAGDPLNNILLEPRDRILVHRQPERVNPPSVYIRGEVGRPGRYPLASDMRVSDLVRSAGGFLRSANPESADLVHYAVLEGAATRPSGEQTVNLTSVLNGEGSTDVFLNDGDVLTVPQQTRWKDMGATVTLHGEVTKPGVYGIEPGERLSSLLRRAGGMLPTAYPPAAVFERVEVKKMQEQTRQDLIQRMEQESTVVKTAVTTSGSEEAALQQAAIQQRERVVDALRRAPISGRLVVHIRLGQKDFPGSPDDIELRAGDSLDIPKQPGFVLIVGQVYNSNAITYTPGKTTAWYLSRAGGATGLANKRAIFIIRASGSVTSGSGGMWSGGVESSTIGPGDTIMVPERAAVGSSVWKNLVAIAQIAQAGALAAAVAIQ
ncbi:MAG TPA: SLBB domain-containing protein [Verrucomicrobiae bacterium]|nr:SLBB domain-containing protein [Verrucomicrobiae bacterium]